MELTAAANTNKQAKQSCPLSDIVRYVEVNCKKERNSQNFIISYAICEK